MARENRFSRRILGKMAYEFILLAREHRVRSRLVSSAWQDVSYVFLYVASGTDSNSIQAELGIRCMVARGLSKERKIVIGIAIEEWNTGGSRSVLLYYEKQSWTADDENDMKEAQKEFGYFVKPVANLLRGDEYPATDSDRLRTIPIPAPNLLRTGVGRIGRNDRCPCGSGKKYKRCHGK
jgi:hypothetical protein